MSCSCIGGSCVGSCGQEGFSCSHDGQCGNMGGGGGGSSGGGSGPGPGPCFQEGTKIETSKGLKSIENVKVGDIVKSYDIKNSEIIESKVYETFEHKDNSNGLLLNGIIKTTTNHPFYSDGKWVEASNLKPGDKILYIDGEEHLITTIEPLNYSTTVYNFEVEGAHNYFAEGYLVHNKDTNEPRPIPAVPKIPFRRRPGNTLSTPCPSNCSNDGDCHWSLCCNNYGPDCKFCGYCGGGGGGTGPSGPRDIPPVPKRRGGKLNNGPGLTNPCPPCCLDPGTYSCNTATGTIVANQCCDPSAISEEMTCWTSTGIGGIVSEHNCPLNPNCLAACGDSGTDWSYVPGYIAPPSGPRIIPPIYKHQMRTGGSILRRGRKLTSRGNIKRKGGYTKKSCPDGFTDVDEWGNNIC